MRQRSLWWSLFNTRGLINLLISVAFSVAPAVVSWELSPTFFHSCCVHVGLLWLYGAVFTPWRSLRRLLMDVPALWSPVSALHFCHNRICSGFVFNLINGFVLDIFNGFVLNLVNGFVLNLVNGFVLYLEIFVLYLEPLVLCLELFVLYLELFMLCLETFVLCLELFLLYLELFCYFVALWSRCYCLLLQCRCYCLRCYCLLHWIHFVTSVDVEIVWEYCDCNSGYNTQHVLILVCLYVKLPFGQPSELP